MTSEDKYKFLKEAFGATDFQDDLLKNSRQIELEIFDMYKKLPMINEHIKNVFAIESRVKSESSFLEKIKRKDYIAHWSVSSDISENQKLIKSSIPDLIGVRVDCYFMTFEKGLYDAFKNEYGEKRDNFIFDYSESIQQKNGHDIYKFSGIYNNTYHFEVQIKSAIHNVWGEVEHKTVYKNPNYDSFINTRHTLIESLHGLFEITDQQLYAMFNMNETVEQLLHSLFYQYTKERVSTLCDTDILSEHFQRFFLIFKADEDIKGYVLAKLQNADFNPKEALVLDKQEELLSCLKQKVSSGEDIADDIKSNITQYKLDCLYNIASQIYKYNEMDDFYRHVINELIPKEVPDFDSDYSAWSGDNNNDDGNLNSEEKDYLDKLILINEGLK